MALLDGSDVLRRSCRNNKSAATTAFRAQIDQPVGTLDHIDVVFYDQNGVSCVYQRLKGRQKLPEVIEVQPGRGFVKDVQHPLLAVAGKVGSQLDPLGLTAR